MWPLGRPEWTGWMRHDAPADGHRRPTTARHKKADQGRQGAAD